MALLLIASTLAGCGATAQQRLTVTVQDAASGAPTPEALVRVTTRNPQHAFRVSDYTRWLGGGPAADAPGVRTGADGQALVLAPLDRPFVVQFLLPGLVPETVFLRENGAGTAEFQPTGWIDLPPAPASPRWRVRIESASAPAPPASAAPPG